MGFIPWRFQVWDLFPEYPEQQRQNNADNNAGGDGKIETEFLFSNDDIPRQSANPRDPLSNQKK